MTATGTLPRSASPPQPDAAVPRDAQELLRDLLGMLALRRTPQHVKIASRPDAAAGEELTYFLPPLWTAAMVESEYGRLSGYSTTQLPQTTGTEHKGLTVFEEGRQYFEEQKASLLQQFGGKYIAIIDNKVVDSDLDFGQLATRVYRQFGYKAIYMPFVCEKPRVLRIPSPRIVRRR